MLSGRNHKTPIGAFHAASAAGEGNPASHATKIISTSSRFDQTAAVFGDTSRLAHGIAPQQVARAPLWRAEGAPREVLNSSRDRAVMLLVNGAHWHVWNDWYNYVRGGSRQGTQRSHDWETAFVDIPDALPWSAGAKAVNVEIDRRIDGHRLFESEQTTERLSGGDLEPIDGIESPINILQLPDGRIGADSGSLGEPNLPPPLTEADHARSLLACCRRAGQLYSTASAPTFQGRRDYAASLSAYVEWLPKTAGKGHITLADGETRILNKMFTADDGVLPVGFAAQLAVLLEDHIALRAFYPELERHYLAVLTGRMLIPLQRDAVEGFRRAIHENTPTVFHESVPAAVDETANPVPEVKPPRLEDAPKFDPSYPRPPKDPIQNDPVTTRSYMLASAANRIWKILLQGKDLPKAGEGWHKAYEQIKPHIGPILHWLRDFLPGGDGGIPPMPPTIGT